MKLLFIRHGEPDYAHDTLTEKGWREAELLAGRIAPLDVRQYYVSPLGRAQDTARPTLQKAGRTAVTLDWLTGLAALNRALAARAERVYEVVCGIPVAWKEDLA